MLVKPSRSAIKHIVLVLTCNKQAKNIKSRTYLIEFDRIIYQEVFHYQFSDFSWQFIPEVCLKISLVKGNVVFIKPHIEINFIFKMLNLT
jgi:hypothetical protein